MTNPSIPKHQTRHTFSKELKKQWELQAMAIPSLILIIIFCYLPIYGLIMAFQNYKLGEMPGFSEWVGMKNILGFVKDPMLPLIVRNTLCISLLKLAFTFPAPILFALLLNEMRSRKYKRFVQTVSYLPHFVAYVVIAGLFMDLLSTSGSINEGLKQLGIITEPLAFFQTPGFFWPILVVADLWKELGWGSILYLATIATIDVQMYEAAIIDGANGVQKAVHITLPSMKPTIVIMLIFTIGGIFNVNFEQIMLFTNQMRNTLLMDVADVIDTYVYRIGIAAGRYSYSVAVGLLKNVLSFLLLLGANWAAKKLADQSLF